MAGTHNIKNMHRPIGVPPSEGTGLEHQAQALLETIEPLSTEEKQYAIAQALAATTGEVRQLIKRLRESIPSYADSLYVMNVGDTVARQRFIYSTNIIRVTSLIVNTPIASTSVNLQLGARTIPLPSGLVPLAPISFIHKPDDPVVLTVAPALTVTAFIWLMGQQLPEVDF